MGISRVWLIFSATSLMAPMAATLADPYRSSIESAAAAVRHSQLRDWLADGERGLWIQAGDLKWFYARFAHACRGLAATNSLLFETRGSDSIDRSSAVLVPGSGRCTMLTFGRSVGPPTDRNVGVLPQPQAQ